MTLEAGITGRFIIEACLDLPKPLVPHFSVCPSVTQVLTNRIARIYSYFSDIFDSEYNLERLLSVGTTTEHPRNNIPYQINYAEHFSHIRFTSL